MKEPRWIVLLGVWRTGRKKHDRCDNSGSGVRVAVGTRKQLQGMRRMQLQTYNHHCSVQMVPCLGPPQFVDTRTSGVATPQEPRPDPSGTIPLAG